MWSLGGDGMGVFPGGLRPPDPLTRGLCPLDSHQGTPLDPFWWKGSRPPPKPLSQQGGFPPPCTPWSTVYYPLSQHFHSNFERWAACPIFSYRIIKYSVPLTVKTVSFLCAARLTILEFSKFKSLVYCRSIEN